MSIDPQVEEWLKQYQASVKIDLDIVAELTDYDEVILFGEPGSGKSLIAWKIAREAIEAGRKVLYLDCEKNLPQKCIDALGEAYRHFAPTMEALLDEIEEERQVNGQTMKVCKLPQGYQLIVLDSLGYPALVQWWALPLEQRFAALGRLQRVSNHLKQYCYQNKAVAITLDQPVSTFAEAVGRERGPFGGKVGHTAKTIWLCEATTQSPTLTKGKITVWKARDRGRGSLIAEYEISPKGVAIKWTA